MLTRKSVTGLFLLYPSDHQSSAVSTYLIAATIQHREKSIQILKAVSPSVPVDCFSVEWLC